MVEKERVELEQCGRRISEEEVEHIRETVGMFPQLSLKELASTLSEHLEWYTAGGTVKRDACLKLLLKLDAGGVGEAFAEAETAELDAGGAGD